MADGSQLRRRVRMATADEPVDADAIANQAASELRQQIEASPIGERLDRVVQEDRPLASRVASAETPLVDEPDDSPSAREVSFHLAAPTGRGAVRSALRTPGLSADLRPRTPFGEDETGIAPEPEAVAKPEAADVDILEPEQPDRSPAGPDRDATAQGEASDELQELHKAQQHDRRARIGAGVLRGVQALASMIGGAANIPGLSALGGLSGVASGVIPQGAGVADFEQRHGLAKEAAQARQRAEQQAYERGQDAMRNARAEEQLRGFMDNAESGRANAAARTALEQRAAEAEAREIFEKTDPTSQRANNQRGRFASLLEATVAARPDLQGVGERYEGLDLSGMNAEEIGTLIEDVQNVSRLPQGARIGRRGNGGRPGGPAPSGTDWSQPLADPSLELLAQTAVQRSGGQVSIEAARSAASNASANTAATSVLGIAGLGNQNAEATGNVLGGRVNPDDVQRYGRELEEPNTMYRSFAGVVSAARRANPELLRVALKGGDEMANVAGATDLRAQIYQMLNSYFHEYGGANIVDSEMRRYMSAFGQGAAIGNPQAFLAAVSRHAREAKARMDNVAGRYPANVVSAYRENMRQIRSGAR